MLFWISKEYSHLSLENIEIVNCVSQRITIFLALGNHSRDIIPWVPIFLHCFNDFNNRVNIANIFFYVFCFDFVNILLKLKFSDPFILISFNLIILFPRYSFNVFFFLVLEFFVVLEILVCSIIKSSQLFTGIIKIFCILIRRKFKVLNLWFLLLTLLFLKRRNFLWLVKQVTFVLAL